MFKTNIKYTVILYFLILIGSVLRLYNVNFDDFWYDEMVSFWISDPNISIKESFDRIFSSNLMVSYELFLKLYHFIFGYDVNISRYFSSVISICSLILFYFLLKKNSSENTAIIGLSLLTFNVYHIKYSFELRAYILTFLLAIILINLIFENKKIKENTTAFDYILIFTTSSLLLFSHAFSIIIIISLLIFLIIKSFKNNLKNQKLIPIGLSLLLSLLIFLFIYLNKISHYPNWIEQVDSGFYTNFYFSKFFGSRLLGLIFLVTFIYLIFNFKNDIIRNLDIYFFLIILILSSYFLPLIFGYSIKPILVDRYIFFILIPLIAFISHYIILIKNSFKKFLLIFILVGSQIINLFDEYSFKQFYTNIYPTKPEVKKIIKTINDSDDNLFSFSLRKDNFINYNKVRYNYLKKYIEMMDYNLTFVDYYNDENNPNKIWFIYFKDITDKKFSIPLKLNDYSVLSSEFFNRVEVHLLKKK